jgi:hypothetical protein
MSLSCISFSFFKTTASYLEKLIANFPVPEFAQKFPVFKATNALPKSDPKDAIWWLWDGKKEWRVGKLSEKEQKKYPYRIFCDNIALIYHIETGLSAGRKLC